MATQVNDWGDEEMDVRELVAHLWKRRWWVLASVILTTSAFAIVAFTARPVYRASVVLVSANNERNSLGASLGSAIGQLGGLASLAGIGLGTGDSGVEEALAVLKSREFTERFIAEKNLMPVLFSELWNSATSTWSRQPTPAKAYKYFSGDIRTVVQDKKTGLISLHIDWTDREQAAVWANGLVERLNGEMRSRAIEKSAASIRYLERELTDTSEIATREAINRLIEAQVRQRMLANVSQEFAFRVVDRALPPDEDDPIRPNIQLMLAAGVILGLFFGLSVALLHKALTRG